MNLSSYAPHSNFDRQYFSLKYFEMHSSFSHVPQIEDYWVDFQDDNEVRKRFWLRLTMKQVKDFNLQLDTSIIFEEMGKEVVDMEYVKQIKSHPLHTLDWLTLEEDDLQVRTLHVITKTKQWLVSK